MAQESSILFVHEQRNRCFSLAFNGYNNLFQFDFSYMTCFCQCIIHDYLVLIPNCSFYLMFGIMKQTINSYFYLPTCDSESESILDLKFLSLHSRLGHVSSTNNQRGLKYLFYTYSGIWMKPRQVLVSNFQFKINIRVSQAIWSEKRGKSQ